MRPRWVHCVQDLDMDPRTDQKCQMYRLTIRATDEAVPPVLMKLMEDRFTKGVME